MSRALPIGVIVAVVCLAYVLYPLARPAPGPSGSKAGGPLPRAVTDEEIEAAVRSYRASQARGAICSACGPRPESGALFCSNCGRPLDAGARAP